MAQSEYLCLERRLRPKQPEEHPPDQVEQVLHRAFIARFGPSRQADGIYDSDRMGFTTGTPAATARLKSRRWYPKVLPWPGIHTGMSLQAKTLFVFTCSWFRRSHFGCHTDCSFWDTAGGELCGLASPRIPLPNGSHAKSRRPAAGNQKAVAPEFTWMPT